MKQTFPALDALRGVAALFVLTRHSDSFWTLTLFRNYLAVDLFFLLSGFVIAHSYDDALRSKRMTAGRFLLVRWIRLYPMYALSLLVALWLHEDWQSLRRIVKGILMLPSFGTGNMYPLNVTYWSLFFEIVVNVLYAFSRRWLSDRVLGATVLLTGIALAVAAQRYDGVNLGWNGLASHLIGGFGRALFGIALGLLLYRHRHALAARLPVACGNLFAIVAVSLVLCSPTLSAGALDATFDIVAVFILFPVCVLAATRFPMAHGHRVAAWLGSASYPLYLLHPLAFQICLQFAPKSLSLRAPFSGLLFMAVMVVLCVALERLVDAPFRKRLSRWLFPRDVAGARRGAAAAGRDGA